jgi:hypothetical protein
MSEKEKMLASLTYNSRDPELLERYYVARKLLANLNNLSPIDSEQRNELFTLLLGRIGDNVWIESPFLCDYGEHIFIDDGKIGCKVEKILPIGLECRVFLAKENGTVLKEEKGINFPDTDLSALSFFT